MQIHFLLKKNNNKLLEIIQNHLILFTGTSGNQNKKTKTKTNTWHTLHIAIWCCLLFTSRFVNKYMYSIIPFKSIGSILSASSYWYTTRSTLLGGFIFTWLTLIFWRSFFFFRTKTWYYLNTHYIPWQHSVI